MPNMLKEFYNYIANNTISFFRSKESNLCQGERYCLKLDNEEMVKEVDDALRERTSQENIQGEYEYKNIYKTFTIRLSKDMEIVVASKIDGMTDDFLATLRNAELTEKKHPILMITHSPIDTITSGTGDLSSKGMPFYATSIIGKIKEDMKNTQLSIADKVLLEIELKRKQSDRFSDKTSLYEYSNLLTVLGRGYIKKEDYPEFLLLYDPDSKNWTDEKNLNKRVKENYQLFERINKAFKEENISDALENEFDETFIKHLNTCKKNGDPWYENYTFEDVKKSYEKNKKVKDNPLSISEEIKVYYESKEEKEFLINKNVFIKNDGETNVKQRKKNILIYNTEDKKEILISLKSNIYVKKDDISTLEADVEKLGKEIIIKIQSTGCNFSVVEIKDKNNKIKYSIKICILNIYPEYLKEIQSKFLINIKKNSIKKSKIEVAGIENTLIINPQKEKEKNEILKFGGSYSCKYDETLNLELNEESMNIDTGKVEFNLKIGIIEIPFIIKDEVIKPVELTGIKALKMKYLEKESLEYKSGKILYGTKEFFAKSPLKKYLDWEEKLIQTRWLAAKQTDNRLEEINLNVPEEVRNTYEEYVNSFKSSLPSLSYFSDEIKSAAIKYVSSVKKALDCISEGKTLSEEQSNLLFLGTIIEESDESIISMSPLHPLNVQYQLMLLEEEGIEEVRDDLIKKLSPLYLLPYIKDKNKNLYHTVEQNISPEWRVYAQYSNKRYYGARNYIQKLVCDKIIQYKDHFSFLFEDIGNNIFCINLINMGDCKEVFQGIIRYYAKELEKDILLEDLTLFIINIYNEETVYNDFNILSNQKKLYEYIENSVKEVKDINEMITILSSKIKCYYRNSNEKAYQYAHLAFYEMVSLENDSVSRMNSITTGISLNGIISGVPSVLNENWYKTGFGTKNAPENELVKMASQYNALSRVVFSGSSYEPNSCLFTEIENGTEGKLGKIYSSSNWVVFIEPKVDLSFFQKNRKNDKDLKIIHYSDQYTSASGYDDITVTQKSKQYEDIIWSYLRGKNISADRNNIDKIINMFNAINGDWMLRLLKAPSKKSSDANESNFSREKISILSAIKFCMGYYDCPNIIWIPISLEEMLRVSSGAGYSKKEGLLSARNLGFESGVTSDDILMVGIEEFSQDNLKLYLHPVEVKIGLNQDSVINKAKNQVINTYRGLWKSLWPNENKNFLEYKLSRNFFMQLLIVCCEKIKLYEIYPDKNWNLVTEKYREALLNEKYIFSDEMDKNIGKGTVISFKKDGKKSEKFDEDVHIIELPETLGLRYMLYSVNEIKKEIELNKNNSYNFLQLNKEKDNFEIESNDKNLTSVVENKFIEENIKKDLVFEESINKKKEKIGIEVVLGTDISNGQLLCWKPNDTNQVFHTNMGIIGTMGTGKTQFTKSLITQIYKNRKYNFGGQKLGILIFDYKGDYNESKEDFIEATNATVLKPYHLPFNPLALIKSKTFKPLLPIHIANSFKDTLSKIYNLGPKQQNILFSCIINAYNIKEIFSENPNTWNKVAPTFDTVYNIYKNNEEIKKTDSLAAVMDKLYQFQIFEDNPEKTISLFELLEGVVVIDLLGYDSDIQSLIVAITLDLFYSQMQAVGSSKMDQQYRQLTKFILVDEADNFMSEGFPALKKILKEGREFGVGTILSTQFLNHFGSGEDDYSKYILTWVVHNVADLKFSDIEFVFKVEGKSSEGQILFNDIKSLDKHQSIIKIGNSQPKYVRDKAFWELYKEIK